MQPRIRVILAVLALSSPGVCSWAAVPINDARAQILFPAVARVMLQRDATSALLQYCASRFVSLRSPGDTARTLWLQRNQEILQKAAALRERLRQSLKQQQSGLKAETFNLDIEQLVEQNVRKQVNTLASYPPAQQHALCNHLILAVRAGDWDIAHKQARAYSILENFH